ncbi:MAG TPA: polysaccharide lyase family 7 protein [Oceanithermus profundus]|uniref:Polysaccharide lyase family 7 protein n=1 Tax=Oceanithermus profundus TaxID=187137 RepID=A0A7C4V6M2_9DEIN|nr:polysaccharide lyase family 7 protein [Oceanithermus profundus]
MHRIVRLAYGPALVAAAVLLSACAAKAGPPPAPAPDAGGAPENDLDLSLWKLQLPDDPYKVEPPELAAMAHSGALKPYFYFDEEGALVFYTVPLETTAHSHYSRTELREQRVPGRDDVNWTLAQGGRLRARLQLRSISKDGDGRPHRTIVMQIHARLSDEQMERIGADSPTGPPLLKVYWQDGQLRAFVKKLKDPDAADDEILRRSAWEDEKYTFQTPVGYKPFDLEVVASAGRLEVVLNQGERHVWQTPSLARWPFEDYFKAGNYLQTRDEGAQATVAYYELEVDHP